MYKGVLWTYLSARLRQVCYGCQVTVLNSVNAGLPFLPADDKVSVSEEVRLKTRVLDLR